MYRRPVEGKAELTLIGLVVLDWRRQHCLIPSVAHAAQPLTLGAFRVPLPGAAFLT